MRAMVLGAALMAAAPIQAQQIVTSPAPAKVAVTIYRAPDRDAGQAIDPAWLRGYALISEEREVMIPAGDATIRFEGVAAGMMAETALVEGLGAGVSEKNLDAELLSPRNLYARAFGRPVTLRRTDAKGHTREEEAIIRSAPDGAAIVQTKAGFEIANCGGLKDAIAYDGLPEGLNARPTLSIATHAALAQKARVRLTYLAWGFDWQAHYVVKLAPGAQAAEMTAWVTLANGDTTGFAQAQAAVVGGKPKFEQSREEPAQTQELVLHCQLSPVQAPLVETMPVYAPAPPPAPVAMMADVVVTAKRMMAPVVVKEEVLGDLRLYRVPMPTNVAAHAQKQVALMAARRVKLGLIHRADVDVGAQDGESRQARIRLRMANRKVDGLGLALPAGGVAVVQQVGAAALPVGEGAMDDKAVGETANIEIGASPQVRLESRTRRINDREEAITATVRNANRWPVHFESQQLLPDGARMVSASAKLGRQDGHPLWAVTIPAGGKVSLRYRLQLPR
ncbi:DUF4139 domain-containing protein [Novosphingobium sp. SG751A]|uniref:DUF4139 domain-containing protein n=1 Tax=Novosphingobium sp. SG751A TaxID=2587000 RepID=UPI00352FEF6A